MTMSVTVNKKNFTILYKGKEILMGDLVKIHNNFEILCTAEFIDENYNLNVPSEEIWELAEEVRHYMDKFNDSEEGAIALVLEKHNLQERSNT